MNDNLKNAETGRLDFYIPCKTSNNNQTHVAARIQEKNLMHKLTAIVTGNMHNIKSTERIKHA